MWLGLLAHTVSKWISSLLVWIKMSSKLPAMVYSGPAKEEVLKLDFGEQSRSKSVKASRPIQFERKDHIYSMWHALPDILLEDIFARLSIRERYYASQVCRNWNRIFYSRRVWSTFFLHDRSLTRRKFNYYMGDQYVLDHHRTQLCLHRVARWIRRLVIKPMENFFNLYEFMTILSYFGENFETLNCIRTFEFTFGCEFANENVQDERDKIFGTGGKLLEALKRLMDDLKGLRHLALQDLLLEREEAIHFLDDIAYNCCDSLRTLKLVNCSKEPYAMLHTTVFVHLHTLSISPQHLDDEVLLLLSNTRLKNLYLIQTKHTKGGTPVAPKIWRECRKYLPFLRVHHVVEGDFNVQIIWQEESPVRSVIHKSPGMEVNISNIFTVINFYCNTLQVLAYLDLPLYRVQDRSHFEDRPDSALVLLAKCCPFLDTLVIREKISSATLLLLSKEARNLERLVIRKKTVLLKCDWPQNPEWNDTFYNWLTLTSSNLDATCEELSKVLGYKWQPLADDEFRNFEL